MVFINLPVTDLDRAVGFYEALGYSVNPDFTDETAACIVVSSAVYVMLLTHAKFQEFTDKSIADPGTIEFVPRPDWFFYFLFYLLRIFKWPETVFLGTVGVPTILLILLIALPFYDRRPERRISRRPVALVAAILTVISMGVLTWKGATAKEALGSEIIAAGTIDEWAAEQGFADNEAAVAGATLFAQSGCLNCHAYLGEGNGNLGAPDLSETGASDRGVDFFKSYVSNPAQYGNNVMISYGYLGDENLTNLATFLDASRGGESADGG